MPPSWLAMMTGRPAARSTTMPEVQLARNRQALLDEQPGHLAPFGTGLVRHERHAVNLIGELVGVSRILRELDAAALAPSARVNLCFHDDGAAAEPLGHALCLGSIHHGLARRHRHTVFRKNLFGLILVNFHM